MSSTQLYVWQDVIDHLLDMMGAASDAKAVRMVKSACVEAYRNLASAKDGGWLCFIQQCRIQTVAQYNTGTIAYTQATRALTLTTGTWPSWADLGSVTIANITYPVASRDSDTQLTLSVNSNPGADIASATAYMLYQDTYTLPVDFGTAGDLVDLTRRTSLEFVSPQEWLDTHRTYVVPSVPRCYTIRSSPHYAGVLALSFSPPPSIIYNYDFIERRLPRPLQVAQYNTGTVTTSGTSGTVNGGGAFTSNMVGSVIRFGTDATTQVTGVTGENPYSAMRVIQTVPTSTTFTIDTALDADVTGWQYEVSDPIDLESAAMYSAFLRGCEHALAIRTRRDDVSELLGRYRMELKLAAEADSRSNAPRPSQGRHYIRLKEMPYTNPA